MVLEHICVLPYSHSLFRSIYVVRWLFYQRILSGQVDIWCEVCSQIGSVCSIVSACSIWSGLYMSWGDCISASFGPGEHLCSSLLALSFQVDICREVIVLPERSILSGRYMMWGLCTNRFCFLECVRTFYMVRSIYVVRWLYKCFVWSCRTSVLFLNLTLFVQILWKID